MQSRKGDYSKQLAFNMGLKKQNNRLAIFQMCDHASDMLG